MRLKHYREILGWTQARLAQESGVAQSSISELEAGIKQPTLPVIKRLAGALGVTLDELAGEAPLKAVNQ